MDILNTRNELQVEFTSLFFGESGVSDDVVEELASIAVLHDHIELFLCLDDFVQLNHIWVTHLLKDFYFSCYPLNVLLIMNLVFFEDFNGHL